MPARLSYSYKRSARLGFVELAMASFGRGFDSPDQFAGAGVPVLTIGGRLRLPWMPDRLPSKVKFRLFGLDFIQ